MIGRQWAGLGLWITLLGGAAAQEPFAFPTDQGGKRLAALLKPGSQLSQSLRTTPLPRPAPAFLEKPETPAAGPPIVPPRLRLKDVTLKAPRHPVEPAALAWYFGDPTAAAPLRLPEGVLARWPGLPTHQTPQLPSLAQPSRDRASLGNPTFETSVAEALRPIAIPRAGPMPFAALNLPDPFEHRRVADLREPPPEDPVPPLGGFPRIPGR